MSDTLVIVMAHAGTEEACKRHLPYWQKEGTVMFYSPLDSVVNLGPEAVAMFGHKGHHSEWANKRFLEMLKIALRLDYERIVIQEYDSVSLVPSPGFPESGIAGNVFRDTRPTRGFVGTTFIHPPLMMGMDTLISVIGVLQNQTDQEQFMWDRWLGLAVERAGIESHDLQALGRGFSKNTIEGSDLILAQGAAARGAVCFHGVKSGMTFCAIERAVRERA